MDIMFQATIKPSLRQLYNKAREVQCTRYAAKVTHAKQPQLGIRIMVLPEHLGPRLLQEEEMTGVFCLSLNSQNLLFFPCWPFSSKHLLLNQVSYY